MKKFSFKTTQALGHYVYALVDPFTKEIFYVGKASSNNRAFDHLKPSKEESGKTERIKNIRAQKGEPIIEVLRYGLESKDAAFEVEAAIIDSLGIDKLTNKVRGHGIEKGRLRLAEIERMYESAPIRKDQIKEKYMLFFISQTYSTQLSEMEIYDSTRQFWNNVAKSNRIVNENGKLNYPIALSIYDSVVIRVYSIVGWYNAGSTFSTRKSKGPNNRFEFVGNLIDNHPLLGKKLMDKSGRPLRANQQGYGYIN
jgi:hypothetical protein